MTSDFFDAGLPIEMAGFRTMPDLLIHEVDDSATLQSSLAAAGLLEKGSMRRDEVLEQGRVDRHVGELSAKDADTGGTLEIATGFQEVDNLPEGSGFQYLENVYQSGAPVGYFGYQTFGCVMGENGIPFAQTLTDFVMNMWDAMPAAIIEIGDGNTLVRWNDGILSLYAEGQYVMDVRILEVTATNGTPDFSFGLGSNGVEFSYGANDGMTYRFGPAG